LVNKVELLKKFSEKNVSEDVYSLERGLPNEKYCSSNENSKWQVYYSERGVKCQIREFNTEEDACEYLYNKVIKMLR